MFEGLIVLGVGIAIGFLIGKAVYALGRRQEYEHWQAFLARSGVRLTRWGRFTRRPDKMLAIVERPVELPPHLAEAIKNLSMIEHHGEEWE